MYHHLHITESLGMMVQSTSFTYYRKLGHDGSKYLVADDLGKRIVTLPLHQKLTEYDVDYVITALKDFFNNK